MSLKSHIRENGLKSLLEDLSWGFLRSEKIHQPQLGLNPWILDLEVSTLPWDHRDEKTTTTIIIIIIIIIITIITTIMSLFLVSQFCERNMRGPQKKVSLPFTYLQPRTNNVIIMFTGNMISQTHLVSEPAVQSPSSTCLRRTRSALVSDSSSCTKIVLLQPLLLGIRSLSDWKHKMVTTTHQTYLPQM